MLPPQTLMSVMTAVINASMSARTQSVAFCAPVEMDMSLTVTEFPVEVSERFALSASKMAVYIQEAQ